MPEAHLDPVVDQPFALHPVADAGFDQEVRRALFEDPARIRFST